LCGDQSGEEERDPNCAKQLSIVKPWQFRYFYFHWGLVSTAFGFLSSFLGIGGGILYVPALVYLLRVPVHVATATSLFVLMIAAFTGSVTHFVTGPFHAGTGGAVALSIGAILGAQAGAMLSQKIHGEWIMRSLALAFGLVDSTAHSIVVMIAV
jgi:uncharacterized membrane protein YfcA